jgi:hypothetical protein
MRFLDRLLDRPTPEELAREAELRDLLNQEFVEGQVLALRRQEFERQREATGDPIRLLPGQDWRPRHG